ncbi:MFS transporter [Gemella cuniculi]|uniref:MFS transporter n=1 Tax=Gemella cuniculi TaxID=150240 RepID=UPI0003FF10EF|nr:MFS transporter [Gemella cuniculi]
METEFRKIAIIGAAGQIPRLLIPRLLKETKLDIVLAGRNVSSRIGLVNDRVSYINGDMSEIKNVLLALDGVDVVYVNEASPALLRPTISVMRKLGIKRLIVAGVLGVYDEVVGEFGRWNASMIGSWSPNNNRVIGAKLVDESGLDYTYLRMTWLYNQTGNTSYKLIPKGEEYRGAQVTRQAVVQYVMDLLGDKNRDLGVSVGIVEPGSESLAWVSNAYTLSFGGFLLLAGRLSDLLGRKRIFQLGMMIFGLSSLVIGLAQSAEVIIIARMIQGVGSSVIAPTTLALMMDAYEGEMRVRAISYYGAMAGIGSSVGLLLGGGLTSFISWRAGFLINVPLVMILMFLMKTNIATKQGRIEKIDYFGSILSVLGLVSFIYGLTGDSSKIFIIVGISLLLLFYIWEKKNFYPIMPLTLFQNKVRTAAYLVRCLFMMAMLPYWFLLPQVLQREYGYSALQSGFAFLPLTITTFLTAINLPKIARYFKNGTILLIGEIALFTGLLWASYTSLNQGYFLAVALPMFVLGIGQAMIVAPVTSAGIYQAPDYLAGVASGLTNAMHQIGGPIGLAIIMSLTNDFNKGLLMMVIFTALAIILTFSFIYKRN